MSFGVERAGGLTVSQGKKKKCVSLLFGVLTKGRGAISFSGGSSQVGKTALKLIDFGLAKPGASFAMPRSPTSWLGEASGSGSGKAEGRTWGLGL